MRILAIYITQFKGKSLSERTKTNFPQLVKERKDDGGEETKQKREKIDNRSEETKQKREKASQSEIEDIKRKTNKERKFKKKM